MIIWVLDIIFRAEDNWETNCIEVASSGLHICVGFGIDQSYPPAMYNNYIHTRRTRTKAQAYILHYMEIMRRKGDV